MPLSLASIWLAPVSIREGEKHEKLLWLCDDKLDLPEDPGVYVFTRKFGKSYTPLYIGQAKNIRSRVLGQLKTNVALMKTIGQAKNGDKFVIPCVLKTKKGQQLDKALDVLEDTLIRQALLAGHEIFNKQGARRPTHTLDFTGSNAGKRIFGPHLRAEA